MDQRGGSEEQFERTTIQRMLAGARTALPGVVEAFDPVSQLVTVRPAIRKMVWLDDKLTYQTLPVVVRCPLVLPYGQSSGLSLTYPIKPGDEALLIIADRSIDNWVAAGGVQNPVEPYVSRAHDLADAVAIVGLISTPKAIPDYNNSSMEIRSSDRSVRTSISDDGVELVAGSSGIVITKDGGVAITGTTLTMNGVNIGDDHIHGNVEPGGGSTGGPS